MDSKSIGEKTEAKLLARLVDEGLSVLTPFGENHRYDFVIETGETFQRLQCKTARDDGDTVISHSHNRNTTFLVPVEEASKGEMVLRVEQPANNQSKGINWAEDYELPETLSLIKGT